MGLACPDADTREIVGVYIVRDEAAARKLWFTYLRFIVNVPLLTPILGSLCRSFSNKRHQAVVKRRVKPAMLSDSTTHEQQSLA